MTAPTTTSPGHSAGGRQGTFSTFLHRPLGVAALVVLCLIVLLVLIAPLLAPFDPNFVDYSAAYALPGTDGHPLGGDTAGRDILSRLLYGGRITLYGGLVALATGAVLGVPTGIAAGYFGGVTDRVFTWVSDALQSIPAMVVLLMIAAGTGSNFTVLMVAIGCFMMPGYFRITRARALAVRKEPYIDAAIVAGVSDTRILGTHMFRSVAGPVVIQAALTAGIAIGIQAGLQFLGIGSASQASWGQMMSGGFKTMLNHPLILLWPSLALGLTVVSLVIIGSTMGDLTSTSVKRVARRRATHGRKAGSSALPAAAASGEFAHEGTVSALHVDDLRVSYPAAGGDREVVHGIRLDAAPGEVLGIVGESGSGKSQTVFSVLDLLPNAAATTAGSISIGGKEVANLPHHERRALLGKQLGYIPQEPMSNLDPCYTIGYQLTEPWRRVHGVSKADARQRAKQLLVRVGITDPQRVLRSYPHQVSGGMAQRVLIAGAVAGEPSLLMADEPTTSLDVTVQAEVLELLRELRDQYGMAIVIVTHNFGVVADICDRVAVMKEGRVVETGPVERVFRDPQDPYTAELIDATLDGTKTRAQLDAAASGAARKVEA